MNVSNINSLLQYKPLQHNYITNGCITDNDYLTNRQKYMGKGNNAEHGIYSNNSGSGIGSINNTNNIIKDNVNYLVNDICSGNDFEAKLQRAIENKDGKALKEACQQVEEIFLQMIYKQMKATIPKSEFFSESMSREVFSSMLDESLMKEAAKADGIGLADMMYKQLCKNMR